MAELQEERPQKGVEEERRQVDDQDVLQFLDSSDAYITLMDSLSSTLRQGWLELASARHSMGAYRINSAVLDLKTHSAATTLQVTEDVGSIKEQPHFSLRKWATSNNGKIFYGYEKSSEELIRKSDGPQLRHRGTPAVSEPQEKNSSKAEDSCTADDQVQKERSKSMSVFGTLVSPKLRASQLSFETALEILVEVANRRSSMLSAFDQVQKDLEGSEGLKEESNEGLKEESNEGLKEEIS